MKPLCETNIKLHDMEGQFECDLWPHVKSSLLEQMRVIMLLHLPIHVRDPWPNTAVSNTNVGLAYGWILSSLEKSLIIHCTNLTEGWQYWCIFFLFWRPLILSKVFSAYTGQDTHKWFLTYILTWGAVHVLHFDLSARCQLHPQLYSWCISLPRRSKVLFMNTLYRFASSYVIYGGFTWIKCHSEASPIFIIATYGRISHEAKDVSHGKEHAAVLISPHLLHRKIFMWGQKSY